MIETYQWGILQAPEKFHPIAFRPAPMPSGAAPRYKSKGHHTTGFETLEEAQEEVKKTVAEHGGTDSGRVYDWDGNGVPALVDFF